MQSQLNLSRTSPAPGRDIAKHFEAKGASAGHGGAKPRHALAAPDDAVFQSKLKHMGHCKYFQYFRFKALRFVNLNLFLFDLI